MSGKVIGGVLLALVLLGAMTLACVVPLGAGLWMMRGPAANVQYVPVQPVPAVPVAPAVPAAPAVPSMPWPAYGPRVTHWGPFGAGFGPLGCLFPLGLILLGMLLLRRGCRHHRWGTPGTPGGLHGHPVPPAFDEWHRQAHAGQPPQPEPEAR